LSGCFFYDFVATLLLFLPLLLLACGVFLFFARFAGLVGRAAAALCARLDATLSLAAGSSLRSVGQYIGTNDALYSFLVRYIRPTERSEEPARRPTLRSGQKRKKSPRQG